MAKSTWTEIDIPDQSGRVAVVTGANSGLGLATASTLAAAGARVILACRNPERAEEARRHVAAKAHGAPPEVVALDLSDLSSVEACAKELADRVDHLDVLVNNAGVMALPLRRTAQGFEMQFGTNHLGHFVLVNRLISRMTGGGRIVTLSSTGHRLSDVDLDDPNFEHTPYDAWLSYGRAKTANVLFAIELDRRLRDRGVRATAVHPGGILTELGRHLTEETLGELIERHGNEPMEFKTVPQGAATEVWAAVVADAEEVGGRYCEDCAVAPVIEAGSPDPGVYAYAVDPDRATTLWARSEELVGETFTP